MSPAPDRYHQRISGNIEFLLRSYLETHPIGELYDAPFDVYLTNHDVFQPDKLFIASDRLSILTEAGAKGAPNLVIEILSPSTESLDRQVKKRLYAEAGVEELWLVNPATREVEVFRLQENVARPISVHFRDGRFHSDLFPGLEIPCEKIFRR